MPHSDTLSLVDEFFRQAYDDGDNDTSKGCGCVLYRACLLNAVGVRAKAFHTTRWSNNEAQDWYYQPQWQQLGYHLLSRPKQSQLQMHKVKSKASIPMKYTNTLQGCTTSSNKNLVFSCRVDFTEYHHMSPNYKVSDRNRRSIEHPMCGCSLLYINASVTGNVIKLQIDWFIRVRNSMGS